MKQVLQKRNTQLKGLSKDAIMLLNTCVDAKIKTATGKGAGENVCKAIEELVAEQADMTVKEFEIQFRKAMEKEKC